MLIAFLAIITAVLLTMALKTPPIPIVKILPTPAPIAQTQLIFGILSPVPPFQTIKRTYSLPIKITTGTNKVTAVQLELQFDPKVLNNVSIAPGSFFPKPVVLLNKIDAKSGRISYALGISPQDQAILGQNSVAVLTFESFNQIPTQTSIQFLPKSLVTAEGVQESVLKTPSSEQFIIGK